MRFERSSKAGIRLLSTSFLAIIYQPNGHFSPSSTTIHTSNAEYVFSTPPHMGARAGMAMEDAYILSQLTAAAGDTEDIQSAFSA
jgi:hypothetical protein